MVSFCLQHIQLDNHSDIRTIYLPELLHTILSSISKHGCDKFTRDNLVALLSVSRTLLVEINLNAVSVEGNSIFPLLFRNLVFCLFQTTKKVKALANLPFLPRASNLLVQ